MKNLKYYFLFITLIALSFALVSIYLIVPQFKKVVTDMIENDAIKIAKYLYPIVIDEKKDLKNTSEFAVPLEIERKKFNLKKIKVYSKTKEVIYSSDLTDVGTVNLHIPVIKKDSAYSKLIEKGRKTIEGEKTTDYVVETYIPIYKEDNLIGYFEIYRDVSMIVNSINKVTNFSLNIQTALFLAALICSAIYLLRAEKYRLKESFILDKKYYTSATKNILFIFLAVFFAEIIAMLVVHALKIESEIIATLYDAVFLSFLIAPAVYLFIFKPLNESVHALERSKEELDASNKILNEISNGIQESIFLLSDDFKVIWANKTAIEEIGLTPDEIAGDYCYRLIHNFDQPCQPPLECPLKKTIETSRPATFEHIYFSKENMPIYVEASIYPIKDGEKITKFIYILRRITEKKKKEEEKEKLILELQRALDNISNLIPICANCKKIRNDEGFWMQIEAFIKEFSDIQFSHGLCPDCTKKLYPDYFNKINKNKKS